MSARHLLHALRAVAPVALLLLAACSDKAQFANTTQEVMESKNGPIGSAITNALGSSTGNPETDAALGAGEVVRSIEVSDKAEADAIAAADRNDGNSAVLALDLAYGARPTRALDITRVRIALETGDQAATQRVNELRSSMENDRFNTMMNLRVIRPQSRDSGEIHSKMEFVTSTINQVEIVLRAVEKMGLPDKERRQRQANAALAASEFYSQRARLYDLKVEFGFRPAESAAAAAADRARVANYEQMYRSLMGPS